MCSISCQRFGSADCGKAAINEVILITPLLRGESRNIRELSFPDLFHGGVFDVVSREPGFASGRQIRRLMHGCHFARRTPTLIHSVPSSATMRCWSWHVTAFVLFFGLSFILRAFLIIASFEYNGTSNGVTCQDVIFTLLIAPGPSFISLFIEDSEQWVSNLKSADDLGTAEYSSFLWNQRGYLLPAK